MPKFQFVCTKCGAPVLVPDEYFKVTIACESCGQIHDRFEARQLTIGKQLNEPGQSSNATVALKQSLMPAPERGLSSIGYPTPPFPLPSRPSPRFRRWAVPAAIFGCLVLVVLLALLPLILAKTLPPDTGGVAAPDEWIDFRSNPGGYSARFPSKPQLSEKAVKTPVGERKLQSAQCKFSNVNYEIAYLDAEPEPSPLSTTRFNADAAFEAIAEGIGGRVTGGRRTEHQGAPAAWGEIKNNGGYLALVLLIPAINRIYLLSCERNVDGIELAFEAFRESFKIDYEWLPAKPPTIRLVQGDAEHLLGQTTRIVYEADEGKRPLSWSWGRVPKGLRVEAEGDRLTISGVIEEALHCESYVEVCDKLNSKYRFPHYWRIAAPPTDAGEISTIGKGNNLYECRVGEQVSFDVRITHHYQRKSLEWIFAKSSLPPGLYVEQVGDSLYFRGAPTETGCYVVSLRCETEFARFPGSKFEAQTQFKILVWGRRSGDLEVPARLGKSTLFLIDTDREHLGWPQKIEFSYVDAARELPESHKLDAWQLRFAGHVPLLSGKQAVAGGSQEAVALMVKLHNLPFAVSGKRDLAASLASIDASDLGGFDSLVLFVSITELDLVEERCDNFKKQLTRLAGVRDMKVHLIVVRDRPADDFELWIARQGISVFSYVP
jgi:hypothetical protein